MATRRNIGSVAIGNADVTLNKLLELTASIDSIGEAEVNEALRVATKQAEPIAQRFAVSNFSASGVDSKSGKLRQEVAKSQLIFSERSGGGRSTLVFMMTRGLAKKEYIKANSVNYGAVRSKSKLKISAGRREKLKRAIQSGVNASSGIQRVGRNLNINTNVSKTAFGSTEVNTSLGSATVTKAFNFFGLKREQKSEITAMVLNNAIAYIENMIGRRK